MNTFEADFEAEKKTMMDFMLKHEKFTRAEVFAAVGGPTTRRKHYLRTLKKQGIVTHLKRVGNTAYYTAHDLEARQCRAAEKRDTPAGAMWKAIRVMSVFTLDDIVSSLSATESAVEFAQVQKYCTSLLSAGYLKVTQKARPANNRPARYLLVRDSGPLPPNVKRMQVVVDGNEDRVVHVHGARL